MAVSVKIGDRSYEVAVPYKLRQLEEAAPFIDAINEAVGAAEGAPAMTGTMQALRNMLGALLPGIRKLDPSVTLEALVDEFDPNEWQEIRVAFDAIFKRSGLGAGEAVAAAAEASVAA